MIHDEPATFTLEALDRAGHPTSMPAGVPSWSVSDSTIATVTPAADGLSAVLMGHKPGSVSVSATLDGIGGSLSVSLLPGQAASFKIVEKPAIAAAA